MQSLNIKNGPVVLYREDFSVSSMFRLSPLGNGSFVPSLVEFGQMVLKKKVKMCKFIDRRTDGRRDGHQVIRKTQTNLIQHRVVEVF